MAFLVCHKLNDNPRQLLPGFRRHRPMNFPIPDRKQKARGLRSGLSQEDGAELMFARAGPRGLRILLDVFFDELRQALNQPAASADHVQSAFMLMFFQNVV
jgi:hypothetical protein